ncbi:putative GPI-anchored protein pfl2 isoform X2 [Portunus trituberculatus]|uniref:putative GPI-anchored protein pfl2 isoform X2 n=1 Tax=Portunus trituberculatus TaxID=210409 RepID=UPI001E1CCBCA|nr:putative GPI-anchored protein pfl2 isoform X2 [Portunus trituberculatus]
METLTVPVLDHPLQDEEADQMGDESVDTSNGSRGDEMCRLSGSLDEEHVAISQLLELPHHGEDTATAVPPDPPDLSPGLTHKVNGAVIRRVSYHGAAGKHALRQQARRRRRNTSIAAGNSPPITRVTMKTVAATSPNPTPHAVQPANTTTSTTMAATVSTSMTTPTTSAVSASSSTTTTCLSTSSTTVASLLSQLPEACTSNTATSPSPPICRMSNKMAHSPNQLSSTRLSNKTCVSSTYHPILGTRVSSRIANNAATSGLSHLNSGTSYMTNLTQSGVFPNIASGIQASRVVRIPACQSSPSSRDASSPSMTTMQTYLAGIPGFKPRKRSQRKLSAAAQLAQTKEGNVDLETPDSILAGVNVRAILNKHTFSTLPPAYQHRLIQLLPHVDQAVGTDDALKLTTTSLNNEFFGRACESWRCRLGEGEFTHDNQIKLKVEAEKERTKLDPWKVAHFEPLWGVKQPWCSLEGEGSMSSPSSPSGDTFPASPADLSCTSPAFTSNFTPSHIHQLTKVIEHIANRDQRRTERRAARRALRQKKTLSELYTSSTPPLVSSSQSQTTTSSLLSCSATSQTCSSPTSSSTFSCSSMLSTSSGLLGLSSVGSSIAISSVACVPVSSSVISNSVTSSVALSSPSASLSSTSSSSSLSSSSSSSLSSSGAILAPSSVLPDHVLSSPGLSESSCIIVNPVSSSLAAATSSLTLSSSPASSMSSSLPSSSTFSPTSSTFSPSSSSSSSLLTSSPSLLSSSLPPDSSSGVCNPSTSTSAVLLPVSSLTTSPVCVASTSLSVTNSTVTLIPSKGNTVPIGNNAVLAVSDRNAVQTQIITLDQSGISKESLKRKELVPVTVPVPTKKKCVSDSDQTNSSVPKSGSTLHFAQKKSSPVSSFGESLQSKVPITPIIGSLRTATNITKVLTSPVVSQAKSLCSGKPASMLLVSSPSQSSSGQVPSSPISRTSPGMRVSPGPSPSPSRLSPVVQVVPPSLGATLASSPPGTRTVVVTGPSKPIEVEVALSQGAKTNVQTIGCLSTVSGAPKVKTVKALPQSVASGGTMTVKLTKGRTPGVVNIQRSYEIVQAVIANSPNRDQLQAQLKTPASLLAEVKPALNNAGVNSALVVNSTNANVSTSNNNGKNNSNLVVHATPQLQTITVVKAVSSNSNSSGHIISNNNNTTTSTNSNSSSNSIITPVQTAQIMTSIPRTVKQVAVTVGSTSGSMTQVQGGATTATSAGALVLRQMMTSQLATSQVSVSSTLRASAFLLDKSLSVVCGSFGDGDSGTIRKNSHLNYITQASRQRGIDNIASVCSSFSKVSNENSVIENCEENYGSNFQDTTTTMMVVSHASCGTITNNHLMMLHPNNNGNGPLLVSIPPDHQPSKSCPNPKGTSSLLSTHLSTSPVSPLGFGTPNSFQTAHLMPVPTSSVSLSNCRPLLVQTEACEGSMAPPLASTRPITILRQSPSGRPLVVRMPVSGLQVLRLGSRANPSGDCNSSSDSGNQQQQQHPPRAASAPPNKSGVMVALSPRPSSVGPRIVVQTSNAQVSPASILNTSGHFLSEGDPSSGVSNCDNTQFITTRAGASPSLVISSDNSDYNHPLIISTTNSLKRPAVNVSVGPSYSGIISPSTTSINTISGSPAHSQAQQSVSQQPMSQHSIASIRSNMNNIQHIDFQTQSSANNMQPVSSLNMQPGNNVQSVNNIQHIVSSASMNGMAVTGPGNQNFSSGKNDTNEEGCPCNMKAMIICMKCGAFCHHDCIGPTRLCVACLIR